MPEAWKCAKCGAVRPPVMTGKTTGLCTKCGHPFKISAPKKPKKPVKEAAEDAS